MFLGHKEFVTYSKGLEDSLNELFSKNFSDSIRKTLNKSEKCSSVISIIPGFKRCFGFSRNEYDE